MKRVDLRATHQRFIKHGKPHFVGFFTQFLNISRAAGFLAKGMGWKAEHCKPTTLVFLMQGLQIFILGSIATKASCVYNQQYFLFVLAQVLGLALEGSKRMVEQGRTGGRLGRLGHTQGSDT